jgi:twitching motility protein PilT
VELSALLQHAMEVQGSDLYVKVGAPPQVRIDGRLQAAPFPTVEPADTETLTEDLVSPSRRIELDERGQVDLALSVSGIGRFRVHVYRQRGSLAIVFRRVLPGIPAWDRLGMPPIIERVAAEGGGLVVVAGPAGSGKTTTVNAVIDYINENRCAHIVTIEDPVEYLHPDKQSIISQREVGTDLADQAEGVHRSLRQSPDVLFVSDIGSRETMDGVLAAAGTGHLVLTTMATTSASDTLRRLLDFYPPHQQEAARQDIGRALRIVISQRLLERADGRGRTPAVEVLVNTPKVYECIVDPGRDAALERLVAEGQYYGMQSFDQALFTLYKDGMVSLRDAMAIASEPEDLRIQLQRAGLVGA